MKKQNMKQTLLLLLYSLAICLLVNIVILRLLPKVVVSIADALGYQLLSSDLLTKYCMGIGVRLIGIVMFLYIIKKMDFYRWFTYRIKASYLAISWVFFIYMIANIEIGDSSEMKAVAVICMMLEAMAIGFFEELVFRGTMLPLFLKKWGETQRGIVVSVLVSSAVFGLFHLSNLIVGKEPVEVFSQVLYTTIMGIAFAALFLRTNKNLMWCAILHGLYDMASGFGDFSKVVEVSQKATQQVSIIPYLINICLFIPLLFYSLFLLRKSEK